MPASTLPREPIKYYVTTKKDPFNHELVYKLPGRLDFEAMNEACKVLFDYIDFTSFSKLHTDVKTNNCHIQHAGWTQEGDIWVFTIRADRFLRNMVRAIVGTLLEVGRGRLTIDGFRNVIEAKDSLQGRNLRAGTRPVLGRRHVPGRTLSSGGLNHVVSSSLPLRLLVRLLRGQ